MKRWGFSLLLLVCFAGTAAAQGNLMIQDNYSIRGYVIIPSNHYDERFEVILTAKDSEQVIDRTNVSISNFYSFSNLTKGYYDLVVRLEGFKDARVPVRLGVGNMLGEISDYSVSPSNPNVLVPNPYDLNFSLDPKDNVPDVSTQKAKYTKELLAEYSLGLDQIIQGHPDQALAHLEKVVEELPDFYEARFNLGLVYQDLHRSSEAELEFRIARELKPDSARPSLALGRLFVEQAENKIQSGSKVEDVRPLLQQARDELKESVRLDSKSATALYYLGTVDYRFAAFADAERELNRALELDRNYFAARIALINVYIEQKRWQDALDNLDMFVLENPTSPYRQQAITARFGVVRRLQQAH